MDKEFKEKWHKKMKDLRMNFVDRKAEEEVLKELEGMDSDEKRNNFLMGLYNSPQAKGERFGCGCWIVIIIVIIIILLVIWLT